MTTKEKKEAVLQFLYDRKSGDDLIDMNELVRDNSSISGNDVSQITESLNRQNYIKRQATKDSVYAKITLEGIEYVQNSEVDIQYDPKDKINTDEQKILVAKLDELLIRLKRVELGQQVTYDDLLNEINELKTLVGVLGKKHWKQVLQGKLVDAGLGSIAAEALKAVTDTFSSEILLD